MNVIFGKALLLMVSVFVVMVNMNIEHEILKASPEPNWTLVRECIICGDTTTDVQHLICMECRKRLMKILYPERKNNE